MYILTIITVCLIHRIQSENLNADPQGLALTQTKPVSKVQLKVVPNADEMTAESLSLQRIARDEEDEEERQGEDSTDAAAGTPAVTKPPTTAGGAVSIGSVDSPSTTPSGDGANSSIFLNKWYALIPLVVSAFSLVLVN